MGKKSGMKGLNYMSHKCFIQEYCDNYLAQNQKEEFDQKKKNKVQIEDRKMNSRGSYPDGR